MNERLQKIYYIIGIIQRISMVLLTFLMMGAAYKIYDLSIKTSKMLEQYGVELQDMHVLITKIYTMLKASIFF
jgi:hypothetical protein